MADTVTGPTILQENDKRVTIKIVNQSDGSGATTVFGDVSALNGDDDGNSVAHLSLQRVWWTCANGDGGDAFARLDEEDSDGDIPIITLIDSGYWDFREFGGIPADKSSARASRRASPRTDSTNSFSVAAHRFERSRCSSVAFVRSLSTMAMDSARRC